jgi:hypothetical protein
MNMTMSSAGWKMKAIHNEEQDYREADIKLT